MQLANRLLGLIVTITLISGHAKSSTEIDTLIQNVKKFAGEEFNFKETSNFKEHSSASKHRLYYHLKTEIPFSYLDPKMNKLYVNSTNLDEVLQSLKEKSIIPDPNKYDFFLYGNIIYAGGVKITSALTKKIPLRLARIVLHEDWHDSIDLPHHIEEASAELIKIVGAYQFLGQETTIDSALKSKLKHDEAVNRTYCELENLSLLLMLKEIDKPTYFSERKKVLKNNWEFGPDVAQNNFLHFPAYVSTVLRNQWRLKKDYSDTSPYL